MSVEGSLVVLVYAATLAVIWLLPATVLGGKATVVRVMASVVAAVQMIVYALFG